MLVRNLLDEIRETWVGDSSLSPTRTIEFIKKATNTTITLNALVGGGFFNKEEKENIENFCSFAGLRLTTKPEINDIVVYNGLHWKIKRYVTVGNLYTVFAEIRRHNGRPSRR